MPKKRVNGIIPTITLDELKKEMTAQKYKRSLDAARASDADTELIQSLNIRTGYWSLRTRILKGAFVKSGQPFRRGLEWLWKTVLKNPQTYAYRKRALFQGGLFIFTYLNPKYKDTSVLPWFDQFPLVLSLGPIVTKQGIRNLGFNLHLLPPKIRIIVICHVFEIYKKLYRYSIFIKRDKPVQIRYQAIIASLSKYGVEFCVRMYIPARQKQIAVIPYREWDKGIFIPSRGMYGIRAQKLIQEWTKYVQYRKGIANPNIEWQKLI